MLMVHLLVMIHIEQQLVLDSHIHLTQLVEVQVQKQQEQEQVLSKVEEQVLMQVLEHHYQLVLHILFGNLKLQLFYKQLQHKLDVIHKS
jgi:G:T/U-mismatch repair DNA glycosylase